jgi:4-alpha-glucanotransferase
MNPFGKRERKQLADLAESMGVQTSYVDATGQTREATVDDLRRVLSALGLPVEKASDARDALREQTLRTWRSPVPPVSIAWKGERNHVDVRLPSSIEGGTFDCSIILESGERIPCGSPSAGRTRTIEGQKFLTRRITLPRTLPAGYHRLLVEARGLAAEGMVFVSPARCHDLENGRVWGVFAPLYALRSDHTWGAGDLSDLVDLHLKTRNAGGHFVATLPLLASFLDEPFDPSPYNPVSRLFWNELYVDVETLPELQHAPSAKRLLASADFRTRLDEVRAEDLVDYRQAMQLKRRALEAIAAEFFERGPNERRAAFGAFLAASDELPAYAKFRAMKEGREGDPAAVNYHLYAQWAMHEQMSSFSAEARQDGPGLYLDYPLGVHPEGYDVFSRPQLFANGTSVGAPPDAFFTQGQNWGFPPLRPDRMQEEGFEYFRRTIRHQLRYAGMLRMDHVMALHRLFWIPEGADPANGVYVRYPEDELFAVLCIESSRYRSVIVGEDLGTVPEEIRSLMEKRGVKRMYVLQYELTPDRPVPGEPSPEMIASINTHDMPTFTSWWDSKDVDDRLELGLLDSGEAEKERIDREHLRQSLSEFFSDRGLPADDPLAAALAFLAGSEAQLALVNLEDLWRENRPQNTPGTSTERPNWQRKLRYDTTAAFSLLQVRERLRLVNERRRNR